MINTKTDKIFMNCSTMICTDERGAYKIYTSTDNVNWTLTDKIGYPITTKINDNVVAKEYSDGDVIIYALNPIDDKFHILAKYEAHK